MMQTKLSLYLVSRNIVLDLATWKQDIRSRVLSAWLPNHRHSAEQLCAQDNYCVETWKENGNIQGMKNVLRQGIQSSNGINYLGEHLWLQIEAFRRTVRTHIPIVIIKWHFLGVDR